jgi:diketogulonate reductase-like aldo/keto reductase
VFITTKFQPRRHDPVAEAERSLRRLGVEHIDLYLVHWPQGSAAQALLRWGLQHELIVIAKSANRARIHENAQIFDFALSAGDMAELDALDQTGGTDRALEANWWS